jgi:nucleoid DNA-binding protein
MDKSDLVARVAAIQKVPKPVTEKIITDTLRVIIDAVENGEDVTLSDHEPRKLEIGAESIIRRTHTKTVINIPASRRLSILLSRTANSN